MTVQEVAKIYDALAGTYDYHYRDVIHKAEDLAMVQLMKRTIDSASSVLDLGCGTGWVPDNVELNGASYIGVDASYRMIQTARLKHPRMTFINQGLEVMHKGIVPSRGTFDAVVSTFGSLSYLHPLLWAKILDSHLVDGGRFFVSLNAPLARHRKSSLASKHPELLHLYGSDFIRSALASVGFDEVSITGFNPWGDARLNLDVHTLSRVLLMDHTRAGHHRPEDRYYFLIVKGRKRHGQNPSRL